MKALISLLFFFFFFQISFAQPVAIGNGSFISNSPYYPYIDYSYAQSIYWENEIQASGFITSFSYYYNGGSLGNSDSIAIWIGIINADWFSSSQNWFPISSLTKVFDTIIVTGTLPGYVTINLQTPFFYNGNGNIVIAMNETKPGYDNGRFIGRSITRPGQGRVLMADGGFNPVDPYNPPTAPGYAVLANVIINGLTKLPCQSPRNVRFSNVAYTTAQVNWSPPDNQTTPSGYDVYYSNSRTKPVAATSASASTNSPADTSALLSGLAQGTKYYAWVRSRCGSVGANSVWTVIDSFTTQIITPVTLLEFSGRKESLTNLLQWRTATEQNNRGFELQRSANGREFSSIGFVPTKANGGNSTGELSYQFADKKPLVAGSYYRLKQVDFDGKATLSNVVFIKGEGVTDLSIASLYPNPTHELLNVLLQSPETQKVQLIISDVAGKMLQQQTLQLQKGDNNKTVNVAALAKGTYVVKVVCANGCEAAVGKFVKE